MTPTVLGLIDAIIEAAWRVGKLPATSRADDPKYEELDAARTALLAGIEAYREEGQAGIGGDSGASSVAKEQGNAVGATSALDRASPAAPSLEAREPLSAERERTLEILEAIFDLDRLLHWPRSFPYDWTAIRRAHLTIYVDDPVTRELYLETLEKSLAPGAGLEH